MVLVKSVFCPCVLQYNNGRKIGLYAWPGNGADLCVDVLWMIAVFATPLTVVLMDWASIWQEGMAEFGGVFYVAFVIIGAAHRLKTRQYYGLEGSFGVDLMSYCCCYCLAVRQEFVQCEPTVLL